MARPLPRRKAAPGLADDTVDHAIIRIAGRHGGGIGGHVGIGEGRACGNARRTTFGSPSGTIDWVDVGDHHRWPDLPDDEPVPVERRRASADPLWPPSPKQGQDPRCRYRTTICGEADQGSYESHWFLTHESLEKLEAAPFVICSTEEESAKPYS